MCMSQETRPKPGQRYLALMTRGISLHCGAHGRSHFICLILSLHLHLSALPVIYDAAPEDKHAVVHGANDKGGTHSGGAHFIDFFSNDILPLEGDDVDRI